MLLYFKVFMPGERLENSLALHLVFSQVVQDVYNNGCISHPSYVVLYFKVFMPGKRLENSLALHLVFCQVVQDVYNNG